MPADQIDRIFSYMDKDHNQFVSNEEFIDKVVNADFDEQFTSPVLI